MYYKSVKKVFVFIAMLLFSIPISSIIMDQQSVCASGYQEAQNEVGINASLICSFCENLSDIVYKYYDPQMEIPKGRWFGSDGEHAARDMIYDNFTKWEDVLNIFNDKGPRTLTTSGENSTIALDVMMNGLLNSSILWYYGNGTYRVYVALRDSDYNVLEVSGSTKLEATYEFTITFD